MRPRSPQTAVRKVPPRPRPIETCRGSLVRPEATPRRGCLTENAAINPRSYNQSMGCLRVRSRRRRLLAQAASFFRRTSPNSILYVLCLDRRLYSACSSSCCCHLKRPKRLTAAHASCRRCRLGGVAGRHPAQAPRQTGSRHHGRLTHIDSARPLMPSRPLLGCAMLMCTLVSRRSQLRHTRARSAASASLIVASCSPTSATYMRGPGDRSSASAAVLASGNALTSRNTLPPFTSRRSRTPARYACTALAVAVICTYTVALAFSLRHWSPLCDAGMTHHACPYRLSPRVETLTFLSLWHSGNAFSIHRFFWSTAHARSR